MAIDHMFRWTPRPGVLQPPIRGMLRSFIATGRFGAEGNSVSLSARAMHGAVGEYFERLYARALTIDETHGTLDEVLAPRDAAHWREAFAQTCKDDTIDLDRVRFGWVRAVDVHEARATNVPTASVSLGPHVDRRVMPVSDSCGTCIHVDPAQARAGALFEFVERQRLIASWLAGRVAGELVIDTAVAHLTDDAQAALGHMQRSGTVRLFQALDTLPGHAVIALYDAASTPERRVHASIGAAAAATAATAVSKAIVELWQGCHWLERLAPSTSGERDAYMRLFTDNNRPGGVHRFRFTHGAPQRQLREFVEQADLNATALIEALRAKVDAPLLLHERQGHGYTRCKFVSPGFYLHMYVGRSWNQRNAYARAAALADAPADAVVPIPFP